MGNLDQSMKRTKHILNQVINCKPLGLSAAVGDNTNITKTTFFLEVIIVNNLFSNYKLTSNK